MLERNVVTWTTLVAAYARNGDVKEALRLYNQMHHTGIKASSYTFTGVLMACADMTILQHGKEIHKDIIISGLQCNDFVGSALDKICERSVVFWTALICVKTNHVTFLGALSACCHAGFLEDGWQCFNNMAQNYGIRPDVEHYGCIVDLLGFSGGLSTFYWTSPAIQW